MAFSKGLVWVVVVVVLTFLSVPFSARASRFYGGSMAAPPELNSAGTTTLGISVEVPVSAMEVEESDRLVPTGPDPLHHNSNPTGA